MSNEDTCLILVQFVRKRGRSRKHDTYLIEAPEANFTIHNDIQEKPKDWRNPDHGFREIMRTNPKGVHRFEISGKSKSLENRKRHRLKL